MEPKDKAKDLVRKFYSIGAVECKQCALIAVDEIIKYSPNKPVEEYDPIQYFKEVKQEIEKL